MSVKRLALVVLATVGAIAATASPAFALSATADTTWMTNGKVFALAQSGNTLYVGGKFAQLVSPDGVTKIKVKSLGRLDATTGVGIAGLGPKITQDGKAGTVRALAVSSGWFDALRRRHVQRRGRRDGEELRRCLDDGRLADRGLPAQVQHSGPRDQGRRRAWSTSAGRSRRSMALLATISPALDPATGALDPTWLPSANDTVRSMAFASDGTTMFIGGIFTQMNGVSRQSVARVEHDDRRARCAGPSRPA